MARSPYRSAGMVEMFEDDSKYCGHAPWWFLVMLGMCPGMFLGVWLYYGLNLSLRYQKPNPNTTWCAAPVVVELVANKTGVISVRCDVPVKP
jgi:hypothetical protein